MARATSKEATRLWFEYLKRAYQNPNIDVDSGFYSAWGDVCNTKFDAWWKEHQAELFPRATVEIVNRYKSDGGSIYVLIPKSFTPTEAGNRVRDLLMTHYADIGYKPKPQRVYTLTEGAEIKVSALRAYLVTYDAQQSLAQGAFKDCAVPAKALLEQVRLFYMARKHKWRNSKREVEGLPVTLVGGAIYDAASNTVHTNEVHDTGAIRAIRRYLVIANRLVQNAATGDFPGKDYYKL